MYIAQFHSSLAMNLKLLVAALLAPVLATTFAAIVRLPKTFAQDVEEPEGQNNDFDDGDV
jgi:hypothetical protein